jgi:DNA-binding SARP family transcriptional activator/AcrR family transcriptional regulator
VEVGYEGAAGGLREFAARDGRPQVRSAAVEVRVLGPVELVDGASPVRLPRAERALLAALAARVGERVSMDMLEDALWPQSRPPSARKSMQVHIVRLRRALGSTSIVERSGGYRLDADRVTVDAKRVAELLAKAREAIRGGHPDQAVALLAHATEAFRGEPYEDVPDAALPVGEVQRLQQLQATVIEEGFEAELAGGRGDHCIAALEAFVQRNPYRERAWGQLMQAQYQAGRPADALAAYGRARVMLANELGIEPGPALRAIEQAILTHDPRMLPAVASQPGSSGAAGPIIDHDGRATRLAILEAATKRFVAIGYAATTIAAIADDAEVEVQTVYAVFGNKPAILAEVLDLSIAGNDTATVVSARDWMREVWEAPTAVERLHAYAAAVRQIMERAGDVFAVVTDAASTDPDIVPLAETTEERRRTGAATVIDSVRSITDLSRGLTDRRATDLLWLLNSPTCSSTSCAAPAGVPTSTKPGSPTP